MPTALTVPDEPDPDDHDRDDANDHVTEHQLRELGIDPALVRVLCPWATERVALDGSRCWLRADLAPLLEGE